MYISRYVWVPLHVMYCRYKELKVVYLTYRKPMNPEIPKKKAPRFPLGQPKSCSLWYSESIGVLSFEFRVVVEEIWSK